jgi:hypothetical protein
MQTAVTSNATLSEYVAKGELDERPEIKAKFPTAWSTTWAIRKHRKELVEAGALIEVAGRLLIHPGRFQEVIIAAGRRSLGGGQP